ncbi:MAG: CoA-binding protein [Rhodospirillales bacterium]
MLDAMIRARSVAVVGASQKKNEAGGDKLGTVALNHLLAHNYPGKVYPVNPKETEIRGLTCYASLTDIPDDIDLAVIAVPAKASVSVMKECGAKGVKTAIVLASGFGEAGEPELEAELIAAARDGGVRFCGPNTNGLISIANDMVSCTSMVCAMESFNKGSIAFLTQSGAVGGSMLGIGTEEHGGFSHWVSVGNEADLQVADYLDYLVDDPDTKVFALFIEGIRDPEKFTRACAKAARAGKPIVVYKIGLSDVSAASAASHTGAMVGSNAVFDAVCRKYGVVRVDDAADLLPTAITFSRLLDKLPKGPRMGLIGPSGGICGVCADECHRFGLEVPELPQAAQETLKQFIPPFGALRNPIDVTQQIRSSPTGYQDTIKTVLDLDGIDGLFLLVTMVAEPRASFYAEIFTAAARATDKPVIIGWTGAPSLAAKAIPQIKRDQVPIYFSARGAVHAMRALLDYQRFLDARTEEAAR